MLLRTRFSEVCGTDVHLWRGRLAGVPYRSYPATSRWASSTNSAAWRSRSTAIAREGDRVVFFDVHHVRALSRVHGLADADAVRLAPRVWDHRLGERGVVRRLVSGDLSRTGSGNGDTAGHRLDADYIGGGCGLITAVHIIERARLVWAIPLWCREAARSDSAP
jgi:L-iditol 2-dehydrogenase